MSNFIKVTKIKDPKNVEAGKNLAKWNRQYKQKLLAAANSTVATVVDNSIPTVVDSSNSTVATTVATDSDSTVIKPKSYDVYIYGVGALSILAIALFVYFKMPEKTVKKTEEEPRKKKKVYKPML